MPETDHDTLTKLLDIEKENNRILRGMHRSMLWGRIFTFIYWLVILGVLGWSYYFVQPYLVKYLETYQKLVHTISTLDSGAASLPNLQGLLDKVR
ncbi:MAG: hypothetical protein A2845_05565 [Candidatus Lloydbacteria bacterium RIFCSPHIGHO2_01_FULL_49_22]|uniref:Uncharacterized protein n=1 Tax=Candidatus Lloydbacteria bacterium RIFCSPHIGHO2_01_FULL_49_22 TaxID=1798658 RepID=A0A1G2CTV8_9BACT|nr:MAG: hypothetical protein A2845_05565 [Candidatus Lloydbacteria bacterium RIFCSPHIGHO2_01_FULL_49_22]OGZ09669.1 MAG: hypothetical protein A3C14_02875 [Candidatus Lloydbacteria bacterium RIFCSPHIGHO2_02_FULL_50_18]